LFVNSLKRKTMVIKKNLTLSVISSQRALLILLSSFLVFISAANGQAIEVGDGCTEKSKLPQSFICADELVIDCRNSTNTREQLYCAASELQKADNELNRLYQRTLRKLEKPSDEFADYRNARKAFIEGQRAWARFKKSDCEVAGYLNLKGSSQSSEIISCELAHTKNRIADLNTYLTP
jgi:uncharacterized protein YecT (DUF1311 family)